MTPLTGAVISAVGMLVVAAAAVLIVRRVDRPPDRWLWVGAALWFVAVVPKLILYALTTGPTLAALYAHLPYWGYVALGGLCIGVVSGIFEIGVTIAAGLIWRQLGRDLPRAVGIG